MPSNLAYILDFWHSVTLALRLSARVPECQKSNGA